MAATRIDWDRGVEIHKHPTGIEVHQYKDDPGVFLNTFGQPVSEQLAAEAGYDVARLRKDRVKKERIATALREIEAELANENAAAGDKKVLHERNGYSLVDIGLGRVVIEDPDGQRLTPQPLTREQAEAVFDKVVAPDGAPVAPDWSPSVKDPDPGQPPETPKGLPPVQGLSKEDLRVVDPGAETTADARKKLDEEGARDQDDQPRKVLPGQAQPPAGPSVQEQRKAVDEAGARDGEPRLDPFADKAHQAPAQEVLTPPASQTPPSGPRPKTSPQKGEASGNPFGKVTRK